MIIPEDAVEAAAKVSWNFHADKYPSLQTWDALNEIGRAEEMKMQRAALEAAQPLMAVQRQIRREDVEVLICKILGYVPPHEWHPESRANRLTPLADAILAMFATSSQSQGVQRPEDVARVAHALDHFDPLFIAELANERETWIADNMRHEILTMVRALPHAGQPNEGTLTAPESCPNCIDETDCSHVPICRAVDEVSPAPQAGCAKDGWRNVPPEWIEFYQKHQPTVAELQELIDRFRKLPSDVRRLVVAARVVAYENQDAEALKEFDEASEAFADRVPWEGEPSPATEGWKLVPVEPTREQYLAFKKGFEECPNGRGYFNAFDAGYTAAVLASSPPPVAESGWQEIAAARKAEREACMEIISNMRISEAGMFDETHSGSRGESRSNALYDAYQALRAAPPHIAAVKS